MVFLSYLSFDDKVWIFVLSLLFCLLIWLLYHLITGIKHYKILIAKEKEEEEQNKKSVDNMTNGGRLPP